MKKQRENRGGPRETPDLLVIVPSRGRPQNAREVIDAFVATDARAGLVFACDDMDPMLDDYPGETWPSGSFIDVADTNSMGDALNRSAVVHAAPGHHVAIGFMGDDHRPRTPGWDQRIIDALHELGTGIVYGNDLIHGEGLPTAVFMTSDIIRTLGYMAPPALRHLYLDNSWLALGEALDAIRYLPDVIIEHVHPIAGKAEWDEGYVRVNSAEIQEHDRIEFERWREHDLPAAVDKIQAACG